MATIFSFTYYCVTESAWFTSYGPLPPHLCVNNSTHVISIPSILQSFIVNANLIAVQDELIPTQGYFRIDGYNFTATTGPSVVTTYNFSYQYPITIMCFTSLPTTSQINDIVNVYASPNTTIGTITTNVSIGDTVIFVSQTVMNNIRNGFLVTLSDGTNSQALGQCIAMNSSNNSITVTVASTYTFLVSTPTEVLMTIVRLSNYLINTANPLTLGDKNLIGSYLPANTDIRILYTNMSSGTQNVNFLVEYKY